MHQVFIHEQRGVRRWLRNIPKVQNFQDVACNKMQQEIFACHVTCLVLPIALVYFVNDIRALHAPEPAFAFVRTIHFLV